MSGPARLAWLVAALMAVAASAAAQDGVRRFAVIVAENRPRPEAEHLAQLRFADDDGVRYWTLFGGLGTEVELLAVLDDDTQRRRPDAAAQARPPTRAALMEAVDRLNVRMDAVRRAGGQADFIFVFAGHGELGPNGEGRIHLRDDVLGRREFLRDVVGRARADYKHIIIDACHAQALVLRRGGDDGYRPDDYGDVIARYLDEEDLTAHPEAGVLLAASATSETHEWDVFGAGVFSHEVRSGLAGAADVNADGFIEYAELAAFVAAANQAVEDPGARPSFVVRPPALNRHRPLLDIAAGPHLLRLPPGTKGRAWLENDRGERFADLNPSGEVPVLLALPPAPYYYLRRGTEEAAVRPGAAGLLDAAALAWAPRAQGSRGAVDDALRRQLYDVPFGPGFFEGYVARSGEPGALRQRAAVPSAAVLGPPPETRLGAYAVGGVAVAAGLGAIWLGAAADDDAAAFERRLERTGLADESLRSQVKAERDWANGLAVGAGLVGAAALYLFLTHESPTPAGPGLTPAPGGGALGGRF